MKKSALDNPVNSFEEVYKTSYSHGLESIYRLESVDLKTVRKLGTQDTSQEIEKKSLDKTSSSPSEPALAPLPALELDLGPVFSGYLEPFVLKEPLQVLKLSRHTEKCLLELGLRTIGDLRAADLNALVFVKGIGQGHVEEVREKLSVYTQNKEIHTATSLDFGSWIREVVGDLEAKMAYVALEPYQLAKEIPLSALESVEIKKLSFERKQELQAAAKIKFSHPEKIKAVLDRFEEINKVFIRPWIFSRSGVATAEEIEERLERVSLHPAGAVSSLRFLKENYKNGNLPFNLPCDNSLYFADAECWGRFKMIERSAFSYFWSKEAQIPFDDLYRWLAKDFARHWVNLDEKDFKQVITHSPLFERRKHLSSCLLIKPRVTYIR